MSRLHQQLLKTEMSKCIEAIARGSSKTPLSGFVEFWKGMGQSQTSRQTFGTVSIPAGEEEEKRTHLSRVPWMLQGQTDGLAVRPPIFRSCMEELICAPGKMDDDQSFPAGFLTLQDGFDTERGFRTHIWTHPC